MSIPHAYAFVFQGDEIQSEIASTIQWYSDVQWCPKNPALITSSSLDGNVSLYSLNGGSQQQVQTTNKIADSFPGMDTFAQAPLPQSNLAPVVYNDLKTPPVWMKPPVGASFGVNTFCVCSIFAFLISDISFTVRWYVANI